PVEEAGGCSIVLHKEIPILVVGRQRFGGELPSATLEFRTDFGLVGLSILWSVETRCEWPSCLAVPSEPKGRWRRIVLGGFALACIVTVPAAAHTKHG